MNKKEKAFEEILKAADVLEWPAIAFPECGDDGNVPGMVLGTDEYVEKVMSALELAQFHNRNQ